MTNIINQIKNPNLITANNLTTQIQTQNPGNGTLNTIADLRLMINRDRPAPENNGSINQSYLALQGDVRAAETNQGDAPPVIEESTGESAANRGKVTALKKRKSLVSEEAFEKQVEELEKLTKNSGAAALLASLPFSTDEDKKAFTKVAESLVDLKSQRLNPPQEDSKFIQIAKEAIQGLDPDKRREIIGHIIGADGQLSKEQTNTMAGILDGMKPEQAGKLVEIISTIKDQVQSFVDLGLSVKEGISSIKGLQPDERGDAIIELTKQQLAPIIEILSRLPSDKYAQGVERFKDTIGKIFPDKPAQDTSVLDKSRIASE